MTHENDPLERELHALRPRDVSIELHVRIEERLGVVGGESPRYRRSALVALIGVLMLAVVSLLLVPLILRQRHRESRHPDFVIDTPRERVNTGWPMPHGGSSPTLASYRQAFAQSPEAFEALLDRPAASGRPQRLLRWGDSLRAGPEQPF